MRVQSLIAAASLLTGIQAIPLLSPPALRVRQLDLDNQNDQLNIPESNDSDDTRLSTNANPVSLGGAPKFLEANVPTNILYGAESSIVDNSQGGQIIPASSDDPTLTNTNLNALDRSGKLEANAIDDAFKNFNNFMKQPPQPRKPPPGFVCAKDDTCPLLDVSQDQSYLCTNGICTPSTIYYEFDVKTKKDHYYVCKYPEQKDPRNCVRLAPGALPSPGETGVVTPTISPGTNPRPKRSINQFQALAKSSSLVLHARDSESDTGLNGIYDGMDYFPAKDPTFRIGDDLSSGSGYLVASNDIPVAPIPYEVQKLIFDVIREYLPKSPSPPDNNVPQKNEGSPSPSQNQPPEKPIPHEQPTPPNNQKQGSGNLNH